MSSKTDSAFEEWFSKKYPTYHLDHSFAGECREVWQAGQQAERKRIVDALNKKAADGEHGMFESAMKKLAQYYGYQTEEAEICHYATIASYQLNKILEKRIEALAAIKKEVKHD